MSQGEGPMLPFDTLEEEISLADRYLVARAKSNAIVDNLSGDVRAAPMAMADKGVFGRIKNF